MLGKDWVFLQKPSQWHYTPHDGVMHPWAFCSLYEFDCFKGHYLGSNGLLNWVKLSLNSSDYNYTFGCVHDSHICITWELVFMTYVLGKNIIYYMGPHKNVFPTIFYISLMAIRSFSPTLHLICPKILLALLSNYSQNLTTYHHPIPPPWARAAWAFAWIITSNLISLLLLFP